MHLEYIIIILLETVYQRIKINLTVYTTNYRSLSIIMFVLK